MIKQCLWLVAWFVAPVVGWCDNETVGHPWEYKYFQLTSELIPGGGGGGGGGALWYLEGRIRSLSKYKNTPIALISGQKSTLTLIKKTLTFPTK